MAMRDNEDRISIYLGIHSVICRTWYLILVMQTDTQMMAVMEFTTKSTFKYSGAAEGTISEIRKIFIQYINVYQKIIGSKWIPLKMSLIRPNCAKTKTVYAILYIKLEQLVATIINGINTKNEPQKYVLLGEMPMTLRAISNKQQ